MDAVQSRGRIIADVPFDIAGMGYRNPRTGLIEGFKPDLARAITERDAPLVVTSMNAGCMEAVAEGEADAASNDLINLMLMQRDSGHPDRYSIIDIGDRFDQKAYGVAVRKSRRSLVDILNAAIKTLKANGRGIG